MVRHRQAGLARVHVLAGIAILAAAAAGGYAWHESTQRAKARSELAGVKAQEQKLAADIASVRTLLEAEKAQATRLATELQAAREQLELQERQPAK